MCACVHTARCNVAAVQQAPLWGEPGAPAPGRRGAVRAATTRIVLLKRTTVASSHQPVRNALLLPERQTTNQINTTGAA